MKRLLGILIAMMTLTASQASMSQSGNVHYGKHIVTVTQPKTAIQNARVRVGVPRIQKPKLFRSNPHRSVYYALHVDDPDDIGIDDDDKITGYRRKDIQRIETDPTDDNPEGLSENIRWRLFLARQAALLIHRKAHG